MPADKREGQDYPLFGFKFNPGKCTHEHRPPAVPEIKITLTNAFAECMKPDAILPPDPYNYKIT